MLVAVKGTSKCIVTVEMASFILPAALPTTRGRQKTYKCTTTCTCSTVSRREMLQRAAAIWAASLAPGVKSAKAVAKWTTDVLYDESSGSFIPASSISDLFRRDVGAKFDRCIVASEIHDHPRTHAAQLAVIQNARKMADGRPIVVGFEQFYRAHNPFLEQYSQRSISLRSLLNVTRWSDTWGYDVSLYEPIFRYCRVHKIPMVGLNIPRRFVSFVAQYGLKGLSPELRTFLPPDVDTSNTAHYRQFLELLGLSEHRIDARSLQDMRATLWRWYEAQVVWDEYMSDSVARTLEDMPDARMIALIGAGHVQGRVGFPDRIQKRSAERPYTIVPRAVAWTSTEGHAMPDIYKPERHVADIVWYTNRTIDLA